MDYGFDWAFFFYTVIYGFISGRVAVWTHHQYNKYREKKFLKHVRIKYPGSIITLSSVATSDAKALADLREELDRR